jgi:uncharacterized membrane protein YphA (DoxX/SURF4 family)
MSLNMKKYALLAIKILLTLAFVAAGLAKLTGAAMMVATFDAVGFGQWFRYVTGIIEVGGAILLWLPGLAWVGSGLLVCTMVGAVGAHAIWLGLDSAMPAVVLGILAAVIFLTHRPKQA